MITQEDLTARFNVLQQTGQYDTLLQMVNEYINNYPDMEILYVYKGNALRQKGDLQGALSAYRVAILLEPNDVNARINYASVLFDLKDYVGALNAADAAILMEPELPDPYLISGNILSLLGFPEQAMYPYHHAFEFMPDNIALGSYVAELYSKENEPEEAFNLMMQLLQNNTYNPVLQLQMAVMLCFFMQNGVPLKDVDSYAKTWSETHKNPLTREVSQNILSHNLEYNPLSLDTLQQAFDSQADTFDQTAEEEAITFINLLENAMRPYFGERKNLTVLDVGCGTGLAISPAREYTSEGQLFGVDISGELLKTAGSKGIYNALNQNDAVLFVSQESTLYDAIVAANSLPYFADLDSAFSAFNKKLKKDGLMFFSIKHNGLNEEDQILYPPYNYLFSGKYVRSILEKNGFAIRSCVAMQEGSDETIRDKKFFYVVQRVR